MQHLAEPSLLAGAELNERGVQLQGQNILISETEIHHLFSISSYKMS